MVSLEILSLIGTSISALHERCIEVERTRMSADITVAPLSETRPNDTKNAGFGLFRCANRIMDSRAAGAEDVSARGQIRCVQNSLFFPKRLVGSAARGLIDRAFSLRPPAEVAGSSLPATRYSAQTFPVTTRRRLGTEQVRGAFSELLESFEQS